MLLLILVLISSIQLGIRVLVKLMLLHVTKSKLSIVSLNCLLKESTTHGITPQLSVQTKDLRPVVRSPDDLNPIYYTLLNPIWINPIQQINSLSKLYCMRIQFIHEITIISTAGVVCTKPNKSLFGG